MTKALGGAMVLALSMSGALAAQSTSQTAQEPQRPAQQQAMDEHRVTVEGCLVREKDVPGRQPNVAERAGVMEDYILTEVKFLKGAPHASARGAAGATGTTGERTGEAAGTSGTADKDKKVKLEVRGIDDEKLQQFVGQRVEIEGRVDPADFAERQAARPGQAATDEPAGDLPELEGTMIKKASSSEPCNPGQSAK